MPHVAFTCPDPFMWDVDEYGELIKDVPVETCLNCSLSRRDRECHWDFADLTLRIERDIYTDSYSPSAMLGCDREKFLKMAHDYAVDPALSHSKARGTVVHSKQEIDHPDIVSEQLMGRSLVVDGVPKQIRVKPDKIYRRMRVIQDDKTWGYLPVEKGQALPIDEKYFPVHQLSIGAWVAAAPEPIPPKEGREPIPVPEPVQVDRGEVIFRDSKKQIRHDVDLIDPGALEPWMEMRIRELDAVYAGNEPEPLPEDRRNFCPTCPVFKYCGIPMPKKTKKPAKAKKPAAKKPKKVKK